MNSQLSTERLRLFPCTLDDVDALHALWREPLVRRYLWDDRQVSRREAEELVRDFVATAGERGYYLWMLETRAHAELAGFAALREIPQTSEVELFYGLAPEFWGKGLATEAARAVLEYGFDALGLPRIWARTDRPNAASMRVAERLGMKPADDPGETSLVSFVMERENPPQ
ncbi:MAG: GNAT family N-acetyltransferase [Pirellulales bacterium]